MTSGQTFSHSPRPDPAAVRDHLTERGVLVVFNPKSGQGDSSLPQLLDLLRAEGVPLTERALEGDRPMAEYVQDAHEYGAVIGAGGDGTVSSLAYALALGSSDVPLLAFPAGTANLIALNLDIPSDPAAMRDLIMSGQTLALDMGELETQADGQPQRQGFAMLAGAGADANMIKESEPLKKSFGTMAYVMAAMRQISPPTTTFHLKIHGPGGTEERSFTGIGVMVANLGMANFRIPITTDISPSDGEFTVILLKEGNLLRLGANLIDSLKVKFKLGDPAFSGNLETFSASDIEVVAEDPFPLQFDGEVHVATTPFRARVLPQAVRFFTALHESDLDT